MTENVKNYLEKDPNIAMLRPYTLTGKFNIDDIKCILDWNQTTNKLTLKDPNFFVSNMVKKMASK